MILDEEKLDKLIADCQESGNWSSLKQSLWDVFSSPECLGHSWPVGPSSDGSGAASVMTSNICDTQSQNFKKMTKEEVRALEGEKDVDSCEAVAEEKFCMIFRSQIMMQFPFKKQAYSVTAQVIIFSSFARIIIFMAFSPR